MERLIICTVGLFIGLVTALVFGFHIYEAFSQVNETLLSALQVQK